MSPPPFPLPDTPWSDTLPSDTPDTLASPLLPDTPDTPDTLWPLPHTKLVQPIPCTLQSELYHECSDRLRHTLQEGGGQWRIRWHRPCCRIRRIRRTPCCRIRRIR